MEMGLNFQAVVERSEKKMPWRDLQSTFNSLKHSSTDSRGGGNPDNKHVQFIHTTAAADPKSHNDWTVDQGVVVNFDLGERFPRPI